MKEVGPAVIPKWDAHFVSRVLTLRLLLQNPVDWCSQAPCQNGGRCVQAGAYCVCLPGWSGRLCDIQSLPCREAAAQMGEESMWCVGRRVLLNLLLV